MAHGQNPGLPLGPSMSIGSLIGSRDLFVSEYPWNEEMVNIYELSRDNSTEALAIQSGGLVLLAGLAFSMSSDGYAVPIGYSYGNSPGVSPAGGLHERAFGILIESVDLRDRDGAARKSMGRMLRGGGHLKWDYFHDAYGNQNNIVGMFTNTSNARYWQAPPVLFSLDRSSPGVGPL